MFYDLRKNEVNRNVVLYGPICTSTWPNMFYSRFSLCSTRSVCVSFCHFRSDLARYFSVFYSFSQAFYGIKGAPIKPYTHILVISIYMYEIYVSMYAFPPIYLRIDIIRAHITIKWKRSTTSTHTNTRSQTHYHIHFIDFISLLIALQYTLFAASKPSSFFLSLSVCVLPQPTVLYSTELGRYSSQFTLSMCSIRKNAISSRRHIL